MVLQNCSKPARQSGQARHESTRQPTPTMSPTLNFFEKLNYEELAGRADMKAETLRKKDAKWFVDQGLIKPEFGRGGGLAATQLLKTLLPKLGANG